MKQTPNYIRNLILPSTKAPQGRRAWSIDLMSVWLPFFTATNTMGDTAIPQDALGAPLRLGYDRDGSVKFARNGKPVIRLAKPIAQSVSLVRENFVATLMDYASQVAESQAEAYGEQQNQQRIAGEPIINHDNCELDKAVQLQVAEALAEAQRQREAEATQPVAEAEPEAVTA